MPVLSNARYELFAQAVASGKEVGEAYVAAGFRPNKGNPSSLKKRKEVQSRIEEILSERAGATIAKYTSELEYDRQRLLDELEEARQFAIEQEQPSAMVSATIGKARVLGLIIDRREVGDAGAFDSLTDEELVARAALKARELGIAGPHIMTSADYKAESIGEGEPEEDEVLEGGQAEWEDKKALD